MIDPKLSTHLNRALYLIIGPHQGQTSATQLIKEGQHLLNNLRSLQQYSWLLSNFLVERTHYYKSSSNSINTTNYKIFVLTQLSKQVPIINETAWWHILQFYYSCNERLQKLLIQLIIKHVQFIGELNNCYRPFIVQVREGIKWGIVPLVKMLNLVQVLIDKFDQFVEREETREWKIKHLEFIVENLCAILRYSSVEFQNYTQPIIIQISKINIILYLQVKSSQQQKTWQTYLSQQLQNIFNIISNSNCNLPNLVKLILYLSWRSRKEITKCSFDFGEITNELPQIVNMLLRSSFKKCQYYQSALRIINFYFMKFTNNRTILHQHAISILQNYYNYIISVQSLKSSEQIMSDFPTLETTDDQEFQVTDHQIDSSSTEYTKYWLLSQCISETKYALHETIIKKPEMKTIVFYAYAHRCKPSQQVVSIIVAYFNSVIHCQSSGDSIPIIKCCLRFLFRYVVIDPNYNLMQVCTTVLNLRTAFFYLQDQCDLLLCKVTPIIITCIQIDILWDFTKNWIRTLQQNYMDVRAFSLYPILLIIETVQFHHFIQCMMTQQRQDSIDFPLLFQEIMELIQQEAKIQKSGYSNINKKNIILVDNAEIFYKMCSVLARYLSELSRYLVGQQNMSMLPNIDKIILMVLRHIFRYQMYSRDTAYIYVYSLIKQLMSSMLTQGFWKNYDRSELVFYSCALVGLTASGQTGYDGHEIYDKFMEILEKGKQMQEFQEECIGKLKMEVNQFISVYDMRVPRFREEGPGSCQCECQ